MSDTTDTDTEYVRIELGDWQRAWLESNYPNQRQTTHRVRAALEEGLLYRQLLKSQLDPTDVLDALDAVGDAVDEAEEMFGEDWMARKLAGEDTPDDLMPSDIQTDESAKYHRVGVPADFLEELHDEYSVHTATTHTLAAALDDAVMWRELVRRRASAPRVVNE